MQLIQTIGATLPADRSVRTHPVEEHAPIVPFDLAANGGTDQQAVHSRMDRAPDTAPSPDLLTGSEDKEAQAKGDVAIQTPSGIAATSENHTTSETIGETGQDYLKTLSREPQSSPNERAKSSPITAMVQGLSQPDIVSDEASGAVSQSAETTLHPKSTPMVPPGHTTTETKTNAIVRPEQPSEANRTLSNSLAEVTSSSKSDTMGAAHSQHLELSENGNRRFNQATEAPLLASSSRHSPQLHNMKNGSVGTGQHLQAAEFNLLSNQSLSVGKVEFKPQHMEGEQLSPLPSSSVQKSAFDTLPVKGATTPITTTLHTTGNNVVSKGAVENMTPAEHVASHRSLTPTPAVQTTQTVDTTVSLLSTQVTTEAEMATKADELVWDIRPNAPLQSSNSSSTAPRVELPQHISHSVAEAFKSAPNKPIEITLNPIELGRVRMIMTTSETGITVTVTADRGETLDLMRRNIDDLGKSLSDLGFEDVSFAFDQGQQRTEQQEQASGDELAAADELLAADQTSTPVARVSHVTSTGIDMRL